MKSSLNVTSGESKKVVDELSFSKTENEDLQVKLKVISDEKASLDESVNEKMSLLQSQDMEIKEKVETLEGKEKEIADYKEKLQQLEEALENVKR